MLPVLTPYFKRGYQIGLADYSLTNYIDGPRTLTPNKKGTKWSLNLKKNTVIKYQDKKSILTYTVYRQMKWPAVLVVVPPGSFRAAAAAGDDLRPIGIMLMPEDPQSTAPRQRLIEWPLIPLSEP